MPAFLKHVRNLRVTAVIGFILCISLFFTGNTLTILADTTKTNTSLEKKDLLIPRFEDVTGIKSYEVVEDKKAGTKYYSYKVKDSKDVTKYIAELILIGFEHKSTVVDDKAKKKTFVFIKDKRKIELYFYDSTEKKLTIKFYFTDICFNEPNKTAAIKEQTYDSPDGKWKPVLWTMDCILNGERTALTVKSTYFYNYDKQWTIHLGHDKLNYGLFLKITDKVATGKQYTLADSGFRGFDTSPVNIDYMEYPNSSWTSTSESKKYFSDLQLRLDKYNPEKGLCTGYLKTKFISKSGVIVDLEGYFAMDLGSKSPAELEAANKKTEDGATASTPAVTVQPIPVAPIPTISIPVQQVKICWNCNGSGKVLHSFCNGRGYTTTMKPNHYIADDWQVVDVPCFGCTNGYIQCPVCHGKGTRP